MDKRRTARVSEAIREELAQIVGFEMHDPRVRGVVVTEAQVSPDGRQAQIRVEVSGDREEALNVLEAARNHLRHQLAGRLQLRHVPELHFVSDPGTEASTRVEVLLQRIHKNREKSSES